MTAAAAAVDDSGAIHERFECRRDGDTYRAHCLACGWQGPLRGRVTDCGPDATGHAIATRLAHELTGGAR